MQCSVLYSALSNRFSSLHSDHKYSTKNNDVTSSYLYTRLWKKLISWTLLVTVFSLISRHNFWRNHGLHTADVTGLGRICMLIRHLIKAWQNFRKARYLWYAEKLFWFMAKVLGFVIYKWSASNEDFLKSSWIRQSSNLNFPPLEYVSDFEPGSLADQWQWSKVWVNQSQRRSTTAAEAAPSTTHK